MNRADYELYLMRCWLTEFGEEPKPVIDIIGKINNENLVKYLKLENPSLRQTINRLTNKMKTWDGRFIDDDYIWCVGIRYSEESETFNTQFQCVKE